MRASVKVGHGLPSSFERCERRLTASPGVSGESQRGSGAKQKAALGAAACDTGAVVGSCGHTLAGSPQLVGGRSAFGTARLPVWGQLNTA